MLFCYNNFVSLIDFIGLYSGIKKIHHKQKNFTTTYSSFYFVPQMTFQFFVSTKIW